MNVPVYENGKLIFGKQPDGAVGTGSISASPAPDGTPRQTTPHDEPSVTTTVKPVAETTTTVTTTVLNDDPAPSILWGDADCSKTVDVTDAVLIARYYAEDETAVITNQGKLNADVTHDDVISMDDAAKILQAIAKLIKMEDLAK